MQQIKNRFTGKVMFGGMSLEIVLEQHKKWLYGKEGGTRADLTGADLTGADLTGADLARADLTGADLTRADLTGADLTGADLTGADLNPPDCLKISNIHQEVYKAASEPKALDMGSWHICKTTHCRAGWVVTLAGDAGKTLEWAMGTPAAAAMIYLLSDPKIGKMPNFYATNEDALADMKARAELEAAA